MRFKEILDRWLGVFLVMVCSVSSIWLSVTGQLDLYIHPRYVVFTTIMALWGLAMGCCSLFQKPNRLESRPPKRRQHSYSRYFSVLLCVFATVGLLVIKPSMLTASTFQQRGINNGGDTGVKVSNVVSLFGGNDYSSLTVKDWAALLSQTNDMPFYEGKSASVIGFVSPDADDPQNVFYVSRFVVTCCAVDARPIGVPVYKPNWQTLYNIDQWVRVDGSFMDYSSGKSSQRVVLEPSKITGVDQPEDPYVY